MNEIEQAIELISESARQAKVMADNPSTFYTSENASEGVKHMKKLYSAYQTALASLREKAEREKRCEYCSDGEDLAYGHDSRQRTGRIYLDGNLLTADLYSESMAAAVRFCPVCGKKLEVQP